MPLHSRDAFRLAILLRRRKEGRRRRRGEGGTEAEAIVFDGIGAKGANAR